MAANYDKNPAVANFVEYLRIPSVQPNINYDDCVVFLKKQANVLDLAVNIYEIVAQKPIVVLTWPGKDQTLPSILLNSHMDVVPVFEDSWTYPPFSAHIDQEGKIFARGSQDMKCVGIQYLEAIRKLKKSGVQLKRTLHVCFVPDEEIGGHDGMEKFVHTKDFKDLNVGFALDEGMANPGEEFVMFNGERSIWQIHVHCTGQPGHGSLLLPNTAGEKIRYVIDKFMDFRGEQKKILESNPKLTIGDVTTVNLTQVYGGVQSNVVPEKLTAVFDIRLAVTVDHEQFEKMINQWCQEAGDGITIDFEQKNDNVDVTKIDATNPYWVAFKEAADELKLKLDCRIFPGGTDSRYVRQVGIPALGFSPMNYTPVLLHDHDEFLKADIFLKGIDIYCVPDYDTDEEIERVLRDRKKHKTDDSRRQSRGGSPEPPATDRPGSGADPDSKRPDNKIDTTRTAGPAAPRPSRYSTDTTDGEPCAGEPRAGEPGAALPDFFDGYTFLIEEEGMDARFDVQLLRRYVQAYGGVVVEASQLDEDSEVNYVLCMKSSAARQAGGACAVRPDWVWRCHGARALLPAKDFAIA